MIAENHSPAKASQLSSWFVALIVLVAVSVSGCTTKSEARSRAQAAYLAGRQQGVAAAQAEAVAPAGPIVTIHGEVRRNFLEWTEDLTLAQAIVEAEYFGRLDPRSIYIIRNGEHIYIDPLRLMRGYINPLLEVGDVVELRR